MFEQIWPYSHALEKDTTSSSSQGQMGAWLIVFILLPTSWGTECSGCFKESFEMEWHAANKIHLKQMSWSFFLLQAQRWTVPGSETGEYCVMKYFRCSTRRANGKIVKESKPPKKRANLSNPRTTGCWLTSGGTGAAASPLQYWLHSLQ